MGRENHFSPKSAAERYARGRPYFHPLVVDRIASFIQVKEKLTRAIDVGCGTGMSTIALTALAKRVVGVDPAAAMIALARSSAEIDYVVASAESLPFVDGEFDLMTLSSAFHWVDRSAFLAEARRVLRPQGWIVIYENLFSGDMEGNPEYLRWTRSELLLRYPTPPRDRSEFTPADAERAGFRFVHTERYDNRVEFSIETLTDYLTTQSNVIAAVEGRGERIDDVIQWLSSSIRSMFGAAEMRTFGFQGYIWYLRLS